MSGSSSRSSPTLHKFTPRRAKCVPGQKLSVRLIANELREAGYTYDGASQASPMGTFSDGCRPSRCSRPQSYHAPDSATIRVSGGQVNSIVDAKGQPLSSYELEPLLITGLSEGVQQTKRRVLTYEEIPPTLFMPSSRLKTGGSLSTAASIMCE